MHCIVASAADIGKLKGGWVAEGVACEALIDSSDERILSIDESTVQFYEAECIIRDLNWDQSKFSAQLLCEAEGMTEQRLWEGELDGEHMLIIEDGFTYRRCS